jgi:two-component system sensor kinase FixL
VLANATAESLFGYTKAELLGERIELLIPERFHVDHGTLRQAYQHQPQARGMGIGRDLFARHRDGGEIPVEVGLTPMQTSARRYVLASVVDIRARKEADLEAARQRAEVAHLARVAMLGELSGAIAHELNQPLAAILSNAQAAQRFLARQPVQIDQLHAILGDIVRNDKRAGEVIKRLRSLFRKEDPRYQAIDLNDVVREVFALVRSDLLNRQVAVRTELTAVLPSIFGDRVQLQQVLLNLVINGCDAMARYDKRYLIVRTTAVSGAAVQMSVTDQGTGIPPGELEHVFDPFVTSKPQGMGLGLAVCRSIVSAHHGRLWALNNPQGGATFTMELPATSNTNG